MHPGVRRFRPGASPFTSLSAGPLACRSTSGAGARDTLVVVAGKAGKTRRRKKAQQKQPDLEAIGLVLLAVGIFILGVLVPQLPTGDFGAGLRNSLTDRIAWCAYTLP